MRSAESLDNVTVTPPAGAVPLNVTVHAELAPEASELGLQASEATDTEAEGTIVMEAVFKLPFSVAVTTAA